MKNSKKIILMLSFLVTLMIVGFISINNKNQVTIPKEYKIDTPNTIDYQSGYECSGYASAYVLRSMGVEADGHDLYMEIPDKNPDGTVSPDILTKFLKNKGYKAKICSGSVNQLKKAVRKGNPVIAFVKVSSTSEYLHYLPVTGYDEEYIYTADSLKYMSNAEGGWYNRKIEISEFKKMLETKVIKENLYIVIDDK